MCWRGCGSRPAAVPGAVSGCALSSRVGCSPQPALCACARERRPAASRVAGKAVWGPGGFVSDPASSTQTFTGFLPLTLASSRIANSAAVENQAMLLCPRGTTINAASSGPMADPVLPPTWNSDWANSDWADPCNPPEAMRATPGSVRGKQRRTNADECRGKQNRRMSANASLLSYFLRLGAGAGSADAMTWTRTDSGAC